MCILYTEKFLQTLPYIMKKIVLVFLLATPYFSFSQFVTGVAPIQDGSVSASEYYSGTNGNQWFMCWDDTYLYIAKIGGGFNEPDILYFDTNPNAASLGGVAMETAGYTTGQSEYGNTPNLPFAAKARLFWKDNYAEVTNNSGGGWGTASTSGILRTNGTNFREIKIPWSSLGGLSTRPAAFNWLGYANNQGSPAYIYDQFPTENYSGNTTGTPTMYYYQTIENTASGSATNAFASSRESYTNYNNGGFAYNNTLPNTLFDFTLGKSSASGSTSINNDITIGRNIVVEKGILNNQSGSLKTIQMTSAGGSLYIFTSSGGHVYGTDAGTGNDLGLQINSGAQITIGGDQSAGGTATDDHKFFNITVQSNSTLALSNGIACKYGSFPVSGTIQINANGYIEGSLVNQDIAANYSGTASLIYNNGGIYTSTNAEWPVSNSPTNVTIQNSGTNVTMNGPKTLRGVLSINAGILNMNGQSFTLKSTVNNTAQIAAVLGTLSGATNVTVERYIGTSSPAKQAWRLLTAPLRSTTGSNVSLFNTWQNGGGTSTGTGAYITGPAGASITTGLDGYTVRASAKSYSSSTNNFINVTDTKNTALFTTLPNAANNSYFIFIYGDRSTTTIPNPAASYTTLSATGTLQTGNQTFPTNTLVNGNTLIGNPYASAIDLNQFRLDNAGNNQKTNYYYWDPYLSGSNGVGGYVTVSYDSTGSLVISPADATNHTTYIQSSQAFYLETNSSGSTNQSAVFKETQKVSNNVQGVFNPLTFIQGLEINLRLPQGTTSILLDGVVTKYDNSYSASVDDYDASKFPNIGESIGIMRTNTLLTIERRPQITNRDTIFLNMTNMKTGTYRFQFTPTFTSPGYSAFLQDSYAPGNNMAVDLNNPTNIDFTITADPASQVANRFRIVFAPLNALPISFTSVRAYQISNNISVDWATSNERNMQQYEVEKSNDGTRFLLSAIVPAQNVIAANYIWLDVNARNGYNYYRIKSLSLSGDVKYSSIVKVFIGAGKEDISIYPNPLTDGTINLQLNNVPAGLYTVRLINTSGQLIYSKQVNHSNGNSSEVINISNSLAKGIYQLEVTKPDNSKVIKQVSK